MSYLETGLQLMTLVILLGSLIFTLGIIWRVEMKLDVSYKLFFAGLLFLLLFWITDLFEGGAWLPFLKAVSGFLASALFFFGVFTMRNMLRKIDGEK